jgi:uncharacterized membrane protein YcaP (DUF421 family)
MSILFLSLRIIIGLCALFGVLKILGKTQISQITPFDFISSIVIGEIYVHGIFEENVNFLLLIYPILLWGLLIYIFELLAEKSLNLRSLFEGNPSIIIRDGQIDRNQLKRNRLNINQLLNLLRQKDIFSITEVKYAILELNGSLSVLKNSPDETPTRKDLNLPDTPVFLPVTLISDGKILLDNLKEAGLDRPWLENQLRSQGVNKVADVFYAEWRKDKGLGVSKR